MTATGRVREGLATERIVSAAITLADEVGLDAMSMRRLAESLHVTPMALYKHVESRERLIDAMFDRVVLEMSPRLGDPSARASTSPLDARGEVEWRAELRAQILSARAAMAAHPWALEAIQTRTQATPLVLAYMDELMGIMFRGGLSADLVHHAMHALSTRMWGFTREVLPTPTLPDDPVQRAAAFREFSATFPSIVRMATTAPGAAGECDADAEFRFALDILLDAFEQRRVSGWNSTRVDA